MKDKLLFKKMMQEEIKDVLMLSDFLSCIIVLLERTRVMAYYLGSKQKGQMSILFKALGYDFDK